MTVKIQQLQFNEYQNDRLIAEHPDGYFVVIPKEKSNKSPIACPVCETLFKTSDDDVAYLQFECCHFCSSAFANPNREKWLKGWRPSTAEIEQSIIARVPAVLVLK